MLNNNLHFSIESFKPDASLKLSHQISDLLLDKTTVYSNIVILCIGTDRSTGDCLGPLVGHKLSSYYSLKNLNIYGTLSNPIHAKNLQEQINKINNYIENPMVIAIDASLGKNENIGKINLFDGPLYPGAGVNKDLPSIGDISITGIVNISGFMEYIVLQNTRLSIVMQMADIISSSLFLSINNLLCKKNLKNLLS